jgi:hypothetical protein
MATRDDRLRLLMLERLSDPDFVYRLVIQPPGDDSVGKLAAAELLSIRNGAWSYEKLIEWAEQQDKELGEFYESGKSPLPKKPDHVKLDALCRQMVEESMR